MKKLLAMSVVVLGFAAASPPARADEHSGLSLGLRAAYGVPFGKAGDGANLNDLTKGAIPVQLDLDYRFSPSWKVGGYFSWGAALVADGAKTTLGRQGLTDVGGHAVQRVGLQATHTLLPDARFAPWAGVGVGYEWTRYASAKTTAGQETEIGLRGFEASLQAGADYRIARNFTVGPFASFNLGQFQSSMAWVDGSGETATSVNDKGLHQWLQLGLKGTFNL